MSDIADPDRTTPTPDDDVRSNDADLPRRSRRRRRDRRRAWALGAVGVAAVAGLLAVAAWKGPDLLDAPAGDAAADPNQPAPSVPGGLVGVDDVSRSGPTTTIDNRVFVVGDSVMQGASFVLAPKLPRWSLLMDTKVGRFTDEGIEVAHGWNDRGEIGQIAVVGLGNNFVAGTDYEQQIDEMMSTLSGVRHVIWFTVAEYRRQQREVNDALRDAIQRYPQLVLVDWNQWYQAQRKFTARDHLHLTPAGAEAYASLMAAAVTKVTEAANEVPAPDPAEPRSYTRGRIPGTASKSGS